MEKKEELEENLKINTEITKEKEKHKKLNKEEEKHSKEQNKALDSLRKGMEELGDSIKGIGKEVGNIASCWVTWNICGELAKSVSSIVKMNSEFHRTVVNSGKGVENVKQLSNMAADLRIQFGATAEASTKVIKSLASGQFAGTAKDLETAAAASYQFARGMHLDEAEVTKNTLELQKWGQLSAKTTQAMYTDIMKVAQSHGLTENATRAVMKETTQLSGYMRAYGKSEADIRKMNSGLAKMTSAMEKVGISAQSALAIVDKLLDPEKIQENIGAYAALGISISDAIGGSINPDDITAGMKEVGQKIKDMGPIAGKAYADAMGISYKDAVKAADLDQITEEVMTPEETAAESMKQMTDATKDMTEKIGDFSNKMQGVIQKMGPLMMAVVGIGIPILFKLIRNCFSGGIFKGMMDGFKKAKESMEKEKAPSLKSDAKTMKKNFAAEEINKKDESLLGSKLGRKIYTAKTEALKEQNKLIREQVVAAAKVAKGYRNESKNLDENLLKLQKQKSEILAKKNLSDQDRINLKKTNLLMNENLEKHRSVEKAMKDQLNQVKELVKEEKKLKNTISERETKITETKPKKEGLLGKIGGTLGKGKAKASTKIGQKDRSVGNAIANFGIFKGAANKLKGAGNWIGGKLKNGALLFKEAGKSMAGKLKGAADKLKNTKIGKAAGAVGKVGAGAAKAMGPVAVIAGILMVIIKKSDKLMAIVNKVIGKVTSIIGKLAEKLAPIVEQVADSLMGILEKLVPVLETILDSLVGVIGKILEPIGALLSGIIEGITPALEVVGNILGFVGDLLASILGFLKPLIDIFMTLVNVVLNVAMAILQPIFEVLNEIFQCLTPVLNIISDVMTALMPIIELLVKVVLMPFILPLKIIALCLKPLGFALGLLSDVIKNLMNKFKEIIGKLPFVKVEKSIDKNTKAVKNNSEETKNNSEETKKSTEVKPDQLKMSDTGIKVIEGGSGADQQNSSSVGSGANQQNSSSVVSNSSNEIKQSVDILAKGFNNFTEKFETYMFNSTLYTNEVIRSINEQTKQESTNIRDGLEKALFKQNNAIPVAVIGGSTFIGNNQINFSIFG